MLKTAALPDNTSELFKAIQYHPALSDFILIGRTAISLLVAHRASMDLDFCTFEEQLPSHKVNTFVNALKNDGHQVFDATDPNKKAQFKINTGKNLDEYARDYVIDGVKVTFFAYQGAIKTKDFLSSQEVYSDVASFKIMSLSGLFAMKSLLPEKRSKSRDLFDLWYLIAHKGFSSHEMFDIIENYSDSGLIDQSVYFLTGEVPIDEKIDEGLTAVGVEMGLKTLYLFFEREVSKYQQLKAEQAFIAP